MSSSERLSGLRKAHELLYRALSLARLVAHEDSRLAIVAALERIEADILAEESGSHD